MPQDGAIGSPKPDVLHALDRKIEASRAHVADAKQARDHAQSVARSWSGRADMAQRRLDDEGRRLLALLKARDALLDGLGYGPHAWPLDGDEEAVSA